MSPRRSIRSAWGSATGIRGTLRMLMATSCRARNASKQKPVILSLLGSVRHIWPLGDQELALKRKTAVGHEADETCPVHEPARVLRQVAVGVRPLHNQKII